MQSMSALLSAHKRLDLAELTHDVRDSMRADSVTQSSHPRERLDV